MLPVHLQLGKPSLPKYPGTLKNTYGFFSPSMVEYFDLDIPAQWNGDFDHNNLMLRFANNPNQTQANAIAAWWVLNDSDIEWLWHIQPQDADLYVNATLQNKKNWHLNTAPGTPSRPIWKSGSEYRYGLMVYGHQPVRVQGRYNFRAQFPGGQDEFADFSKVVGISRDMMRPMGEYVDYTVSFVNELGETRYLPTRVRNLTIPLIEAGLIQLGTEPNTARKISATNKGVKLMFVPGSDFKIRPEGEAFLWSGAFY